MTRGAMMHRRWRGSRWGEVAVSAAILLLGCANSHEYRIGIVLGSEGALAAKLAVEELNAAGGPKIGLRVLGGAYGSSAQIALQGAESLSVDPEILAIVGHANSSASLAASQVYNARHVVQLAPTTTSPLYSQAGPYSYRLAPSDAHQAQFLAEQIKDSETRRTAVVYVNDDYGRSLRRLFLAELAKRGVTPVYQGLYSEEEKDGVELERALVAARPTLLVWLGREPFFSLISKDLRAALPGLRILASDGFGGRGAMLNSDSQLDGVRYVRLVNVDESSPVMRQLRDRYKEAGGGELTDQAVLAYDATKMLGTAIHEAGPDREAIRKWMHSLGRTRAPFMGASGAITFSEAGDRPPNYVLVALGANESTSTPR